MPCSKLTILKPNKLPGNPDEDSCASVPLGRFPKWLHRSLPSGDALLPTHATLRKHRLNTVC